MTKSSQHFNGHHIAALILAFFTFAMSAHISRTTFERLPHLEDEVAYLYQARVFAGGQITVEEPEPSQAFWQPFVVDHDGRRFGKYTPGWSAVLAIGVVLGQTWWINACLAALTVALTYRLGREIYNADVGIVAALLVAFSPMALLLNATLMGHTAALFWATLFMWSYWRMEHSASVAHALRWGVLAGLALGALASTRPLTTFAIGLPFILWSGGRLLRDLFNGWQATWRTLAPLLALSAFTLLIAISIPLYNLATVGDPTENLYTLVWDYDRVGFGECCGRNTHRLEKGLRHTRFDLSLTAADLYGWQLEPIDAAMRDHLLNDGDYWEGTGWSFLLIPVGFLMGVLFYSQKNSVLRHKTDDDETIGWFGALLALWLALVIAWALLPVHLQENLFGNNSVQLFGMTADTLDSPTFSWQWVGVAMGLLILPLVPLAWTHRDAPSVPYTWLFMAVTLGIVVVQFTYWIGSQRYSTRYYYEALVAASLLTAIPLGTLARSTTRKVVYPALVALCVATLFHYSLPRIDVLQGFNRIDRQTLRDLDQRRQTDQPVLVIVNGSTSGENRVRWRSYGTFMVETNPYLTSEIVAARDYGYAGMREAIVQQFPQREVIEVYAAGNDLYFADEAPPELTQG